MTVNEEIGEMLKSLTEPKGETNDSSSATDNKQEVVHQEPSRPSDVSGGSEVVGRGEGSVAATSVPSGQEGDKTSHTTETETSVGTDSSTDVETKEEPKPDEKDKLIAELQAKLAEKESAKPEPKIEPKPEPVTDQDFLGEQDIDELTRDPKQLNAILNKVYQKAATDTEQRLMKGLPDVVRENVAIIETLRETTAKFYEENPDLAGFKKVVATVFEEIATKDPKRPISEIVKEVASETRKRLDLTKKVDDKANGKEKKEPPKLPTKGSKAGSPQSKPTVNPLQAELEEMNRTIRR